MFAIVEIHSKQYKVFKDSIIKISRINKSIGDILYFNNVILLNKNNILQIGNPYIKDVNIETKVLNHIKNNKVVVFKKKRRKKYKKFKNHRQNFTIIKIENIN